MTSEQFQKHIVAFPTLHFSDYILASKKEEAL